MEFLSERKCNIYILLLILQLFGAFSRRHDNLIVSGLQ